MKEYELCIETMNPCGGSEYAQRDFKDVETDSPKNNPRTPRLESG